MIDDTQFRLRELCRVLREATKPKRGSLLDRMLRVKSPTIASIALARELEREWPTYPFDTMPGLDMFTGRSALFVTTSPKWRKKGPTTYAGLRVFYAVEEK